MGSTCTTNSGEQYYLSIKYKKHLNPHDLNDKYSYKNKIFSRKDHQKTLLVYDMKFGKHRILKQVRFTKRSVL